MNTIGKIIAMWGILVAAAWLYLGYVNADFFGTGYTASSLILWSALMAIALIATYKYFPNAAKNKVVHVWTILVVGGMILSYANFIHLIPPALSGYIYYHMWFLFTAIGYALTALYWTPKSKMIYAAGAAANGLVFILLFFNVPFVINNGAWLYGLVGGLPAIADGLMNYNIAPPSPAPKTPAAPVKVKVTIK